MNNAGLQKQEIQHDRLIHYKEEVTLELQSILTYWSKYTLDLEHGGFYGSVSNSNRPDKTAPKGIVLNSRILWSFSAAFSVSNNSLHLEIATRAFDYILQHFIDKEYGGVYWSVDTNGKMMEGRKQIYGLAFCIYGLAEYYKSTKEEIALTIANQLVDSIEKHSLDKEKGGYIEAFARDWQPLNDLRLSDKDDNEKKTTNTHLHIVEAYANLYQASPTPALREKIINLLEIFDRYLINRKTKHLNLFMDERWQIKSTLQSFGHDIEAAWLLQECAEIINYKLYMDHFREHAILLADGAAQGIDTDGGMWYEYEPKKEQLIREKHSWPQAEAMIGFLNAWQLTGNEKYLLHSLDAWAFVKEHIKDRVNGEWFWGIYDGYEVIEKDKAGFWKCPYHNSRACLEIMKRIEHG
ncbi:MAG: AGE family epimerase/isomerase [Chitinophagaceae bacterium]